MTHYRNLLDPGVFLGPQDFPAEGREVTISRVVRESMPKRDKEPEQSAPMLYVLGKDGKEYARKYKVPKSVLHGLSLHLGNEIEGWVGKKITMFSTKCLSFGEVEECIRVRFPADIDAKIRRWLKKRKASASTYMLADKAEEG